MSHFPKLVLASCGALAVALLGCAPSETSASAPGMTNAQPVDADKEWAIWVLANARCDHEAFCDNVGHGKAYETRGACLDHERIQPYDKRCVEDTEGGSRKCADEIRAGRCPQRGY
jgi:hypothetical protein